MHWKTHIGSGVAGAAAGAISGLFGAGGGMVLVPLLSFLTDIEEDQIFPASVSVILPVCVVCLLLTYQPEGIPWSQMLPYLIGSIAGGVLAGRFGKHIPTMWLHRLLGIFIIWGGVRYLC